MSYSNNDNLSVQDGKKKRDGVPRGTPGTTMKSPTQWTSKVGWSCVPLKYCAAAFTIKEAVMWVEDHVVRVHDRRRTRHEEMTRNVIGCPRPPRSR